MTGSGSAISPGRCGSRTCTGELCGLDAISGLGLFWIAFLAICCDYVWRLNGICLVHHGGLVLLVGCVHCVSTPYLSYILYYICLSIENPNFTVYIHAKLTLVQAAARWWHQLITLSLQRVCWTERGVSASSLSSVYYIGPSSSPMLVPFYKIHHTAVDHRHEPAAFARPTDPRDRSKRRVRTNALLEKAMLTSTGPKSTYQSTNRLEQVQYVVVH